MATRYVHRSSGLPPGQAGYPNANSVRVDSDTDTLKFGTGASGTTEKEVVDTSSTQTLTGKTFTAPTVNAPVGTVASEIVTATNIITAAESGTTFFLNNATEFASTLPSPAQGLFYRFIVTDAPETNDYTIVTAGAPDQILAGQVFGSDGTDGDSETTATATTITFVAAASVVGDMAEVWSDGTSWFARCFCNSGTNAITITG